MLEVRCKRSDGLSEKCPEGLFYFTDRHQLDIEFLPIQIGEIVLRYDDMIEA